MQPIIRMLTRTAPLWVLMIVWSGNLCAQTPQTTLINDTNVAVTVVIENPPFPPVEMITLAAGQTTTVGAPAGAKIQIQHPQTKQIGREIEVTTTRSVSIKNSPPPRRPASTVAIQPNARTSQTTQASQGPSGRQTQQSATRVGGKSTPNTDGTLHVILACDKDDVALGEGFEINDGLVRHQFINTVASARLRFHGFENSNPLSVETLLDAIDSTKVGPNDTLMVYLACHGYWDEKQQKHFFKLSNDNDSKVFLRETLIKKMKSRGARFGLLVTDSCSAKEPLPKDLTMIAGPTEPLKETSALYQTLFFDQQGFLDLSSSAPGELALYYNNDKDYKIGDKREIKTTHFARNNPDGDGGVLQAHRMRLNGVEMKGGLFTESMRTVLEDHNDQTYDWKSLVELMQKDLAARYKQELPDGKIKAPGGGTVFQDTQTITVNEWPNESDDSASPDPTAQKIASGRGKTMQKSTDDSSTTKRSSDRASYRYGVTGIENDKGGFLILEVIDGTRAKRDGLNKGEVIEMVNNKKINTLDELDKALDEAPATFRMTVSGATFVVRP